MGDLETAIAFVARRAGRDALPEAEWVHHLSLGLGWMAPSEARSFVARAREAGLLLDSGPHLRLALSGGMPNAPLGFRPDPAARPSNEAPASVAGPQDPFPAWLDQVAKRLGVDRPAVLALVAQKQASMDGLLTAWAALLWVAGENGLDVHQAATLKA